jgi:hypothetical protein
MHKGLMQGKWLTLSCGISVDLAANGIHSSSAEPMSLCIIVAYINAVMACMGRFEEMCVVHTMFFDTNM